MICARFASAQRLVLRFSELAEIDRGKTDVFGDEEQFFLRIEMDVIPEGVGFKFAFADA